MSEHEANILDPNPLPPPGRAEQPRARLARASAPRQGDPRARGVRYQEAPADQSTDGSDAVNAAFDEFLTRCELGEDLDPDRFCDEHPAIKSSLRIVLYAKLACEANPDLFDRPKEDSGDDRSKMQDWLERLEEALWPRPGELFLGLKLRRLLGRGAFARVFLATEEALGGKRVVVKVAPDGGNEARTLGRLDHPNVVPVHSVREDHQTGLTAVVMPYLGNATLHNVLDRVLARGGPPARGREILEAIGRKGPKSEVSKQKPEGDDSSLTSDTADPILWGGTYVEGVVHLAGQVADALEYVHRQGIFHLDLKPSNVLLTPSGRPMLLDFNLAHDRECRRQRLGGTLPYMAPEQLRAFAAEVRSQKSEVGSQRSEGSDSSLTSDLCPLTSDLPDFDGRADVFALGVLLYELLAGEHPFGLISLKLPELEGCALLRARQEKGAKPLHEANPSVGQQLSSLVHRCLEIDPSRRPARAQELAAELRETQAKQRSWLARHALAACGVVLTVALTVLAVTWPARPADKGRDLEQGIRALGEQRYEQAVPHLRKALETDPDNPSTHFALGRALDKLGDIPQARMHFKEAEHGAPTGKVYACLGYVYSRDRHFDPNLAVYYYRKALDAGYRTAIVYNNLGLIYTKGPGDIPLVQRYALSEEYLNQAIRLDRRLWGAYRTRMLLARNRALQDDSYLPLQGVADVEPALGEGASPVDYHRAAFVYGTAVERVQRRFSSAAAAGKLVESLPPSQQKVLIDLLARPEHYRDRARDYIRRANAGGLGLSSFRLDVYKRLVPLEELKDCPPSDYPRHREPIFDPIDE
jgi:serine/threonine protein kinase/Tfp pilus assembly protein PilF